MFSEKYRFLIWTFLAIFLSGLHVSASEAIVATSHGKLKGLTEQVGSRKLSIFLGIPFARPPIGDLRFRRPEPMPAWEGVRLATGFRPACVQWCNMSYPGFLFQLVNPKHGMAEDCLYLNIWAPADAESPGTPRAVMVWIHGGGFVAGTSTADGYDGKRLAASRDVIVVSLNYRLGPLGFLYNGGQKAPGNMGLLDQQMALRWVKDNIAAFSGDPDSVTIFGESAGGASVSFHLLARGSQELFNNAILQSGVAISSWAYKTPSVANKLSADFAQFVGCVDVDDIECLLQVSAESIAEYPRLVLPTMDGEFITADPATLLKEGQVKTTNVIIGYTKNEGHITTGSYNPEAMDAMRENGSLNKEIYHDTLESAVYDKFGRTDSTLSQAVKFNYEMLTWNDNLTYIAVMDEINGDQSIVCDGIQFADDYVASGGKVFMYMLSRRPARIPLPAWMGVAHGQDIYYVFGTDEFLFTTEERRLSQYIMSYWTRLATSGDPNGASLPKWPLYEKNGGQYLDLDVPDRIKTADRLRQPQCRFWNSYLPKLDAAIGQCGPAVSRSVPLQTTANTLVSVILLVVVFFTYE